MTMGVGISIIYVCILIQELCLDCFKKKRVFTTQRCYELSVGQTPDKSRNCSQ